MTGKICISIFPYYDIRTNKKSFKTRPALVIGGPRNHDYTVLPVSTISRPENIDAEYDIKVVPEAYPKLNFDKVSYVRVHKQTTIHESEIKKVIADMREEYEELYLAIMEKLEEFNASIIDKAL